MKLKLTLPLIVRCIIIVFCVIWLFNPTPKAQGSGFLQLPFNQTQIYRINSYVDHDVPQFENKNGSIVFFNGERYGDCPADGSSWTVGDGQGPYCYDSHSGVTGLSCRSRLFQGHKFSRFLTVRRFILNLLR